jgi:hypothetical protein
MASSGGGEGVNDGSALRRFGGDCVRAAAVLFALGGAAGAPLQAQDLLYHTFVGNVFDAESGDPVVGAFAAALGTERFGTSDHNGSFRIDGLPSGEYTIQVWRLGYEPILFRATLDSLAISVLNAPIVLIPIPVMMPEVVVEADRTRLVVGPLREFYRRASEGRGTFFTREYIEQRRADQVHQIVRAVPGADVMYVGNLRWTVRLAADRRAACPVIYFVDGIQSNEQMALSIRPERLEGLEVYRRPTEIPPEFNVRGASCGVIALWSRR